jgi:excinuclease UvrABC ATPase subunit
MTGYESKKAAAQDKMAQPAQEPVAMRLCRSCNGTGMQYTGIQEAPIATCNPCDGTGQIALAQPAQEPADDVRGFLAARLTCWHRLTEKESDELVALFEVKPSKRPWVGLTEEEQAALVYKYGDTPVALCLETERKLKERNGGHTI